MPEAHDKLIGAGERRLLVRYVLLTAALCVPLGWAFVAVRNLYPFASWTVMMAGGDLGRGRTYYVLRGETAAGETVDLPLGSITNALRGRGWGLVAATVENDSLTQPRRPHPANAMLV